MMKSFSFRRIVVPGSTLLVGLLLALAVPRYASESLEGFLVTAGIFALLTLSWNLMGGVAGIFSLGHAAFFGVGAYAAVIVALEFGATLFVSLVAAGAAASALTILFLPAFRASGLFLAILTLAFAEAMGIAAGELFPGGRNGLFVEPVFQRGSHGWFWIAIGTTSLAIVITWAVRRSQFGLGLRALGDDPVAAESLGVNSSLAKAKVTVLSSFLAGVAGGIYALSQTFVDPTTVFDVQWSILPLLMAILGGLGSTFGPLVGAFAILGIDEYIRRISPAAGGYSSMAHGLLLLVLALKFRQGLAGIVKTSPLTRVSIGRQRPNAEPERGDTPSGISGQHGGKETS